MGQARARLSYVALALGIVSGSCRAILDFHECDQFKDCQSRGVGYYCQEHACLAPEPELFNEDGSFVCRFHGPVEEATTRLVGTLLPARFSDEGPPLEDACQLAVDEINAHDGLDGRSLGLIQCDSRGWSEYAPTVADYLVNRIGVKALIGDSRSSSTLAVAQAVTIPSAALLVSPAATTPALTVLDDQDLVWRTVPSQSVQSSGIAQYLKQSALKPLQIVYVENDYGQGIHDALLAEIRTQLQADGGATYPVRSHAYPDPEDPDSQFQATAVASSIVSGSGVLPDVIVVIGQDELADIVAATETLWQQQFNDTDRPVWILSDEGHSNAVLAMLTQALRSVDWLTQHLFTRIRGVELAAGTAPGYALFQATFRDTYGYEAAPFVEYAYDATYLVALAALSPDSDSSGPAWAAGLRRLTGTAGLPLQVGPSDWDQAVSRMLADETLHLNGVSGPLSLDAAGEPVTGAVTLWWVAPPVGGTGLEFQSEQIWTVTGQPLTVSPPAMIRNLADLQTPMR